MDAAERARVRARLRGATAEEVSEFLERLPRDMLFVMRTWALVSSHNRALGGTTRQRLRIYVRDATHGALERGGGGSGWRWAIWLSVLRARLLMSSFDLFFVVRSWWAGLKPHSKRNLG